jgi:hypothetical protein
VRGDASFFCRGRRSDNSGDGGWLHSDTDITALRHLGTRRGLKTEHDLLVFIMKGGVVWLYLCFFFTWPLCDILHDEAMQAAAHAAILP